VVSAVVALAIGAFEAIFGAFFENDCVRVRLFTLLRLFSELFFENGCARVRLFAIANLNLNVDDQANACACVIAWLWCGRLPTRILNQVRD
jgi:hypothetical protein